MAFKMSKIGGEPIDWNNRNSDEQWWEAYVANLTIPMMEDVCHKILDYYN